MKVAHCLGWYLPESVGGTERYVAALTHELTARGVECSVLAPTDDSARSYFYEGVSVQRYSVQGPFSRSQLSGTAAHTGFSDFLQILHQERPDVFHLHAWTTGAGYHHLKAARDAGCATIVTIHVPGIACARGTMMRMGRVACDGQVESVKCASCWMQGRGVPAGLAPIAAAGVDVARHLFPSLVGSRLSLPVDVVDSRRRDLARVQDLCDHIVVVCQWLYDALLANNVPAQMMSLSRQGLDERGAEPKAIKHAKQPTVPLRVVYLGRLTPVKGLHILLSAFRMLPESSPVSLAIFAPPAPRDDEEYERLIRAMTESDPRITWMGPIASTQVRATLAEYDVLAVPSQWLETGPMVVLEAQSVGVFILGSRLGGIAELVRDGDGGRLVKHDDVIQWARQLEDLSRKRPLRREPSTVRAMPEVATEMIALYKRITAAV